MFTRSRTLSRRPALIGATMLSGLALAVSLAGPASAGEAKPSPSASASCSGPCAVVSTAPAAALSEDAATHLAFSREEERMARDLYAALAKIHGDATPMARIVNSEQRHFDTTGMLLRRYGLADPSAGRAAGSYADPEIQRLYDDWFARGKASPQAAYQVGIELEQRDIADLKVMQSSDAPADVKAVWANLLKGSQNHLAAFRRAAAGQSGAMAGNGPRHGQQGQGRGQHRSGRQGQDCDGISNSQGAGNQQGTPGAGHRARGRAGQGRLAS